MKRRRQRNRLDFHRAGGTLQAGERLACDRRGQGPGRVEQPPGAVVGAEQRLHPFAEVLDITACGLQIRGPLDGRVDLNGFEEHRLLARLAFDHRSLTRPVLVRQDAMRHPRKKHDNFFSISEGIKPTRTSYHSPSASSRLSQARA